MQPQDREKIDYLLGLFGVGPSQITVTEQDDQISIIIDMDELEAGKIIGRFASTLDSLQLVISLMLSHADIHKHVILDVAGYRDRRYQTLVNMVENAKHQVQESGVSFALPPLSSTERRQIHLMLQDDADFSSYSEGYGQDRRLFIALKTI